MSQKGLRNPRVKTSDGTVRYELIYVNNSKRKQLDRKKYLHGQYWEYYLPLVTVWRGVDVGEEKTST